MYNNELDILNILQEIKDGASYFKNTNKGRYFLITCAFHKDGCESHPSWAVNNTDSKYPQGFFHCFTCGKSGNIQQLLEHNFPNNDIKIQYILKTKQFSLAEKNIFLMITMH